MMKIWNMVPYLRAHARRWRPTDPAAQKKEQNDREEEEKKRSEPKKKKVTAAQLRVQKGPYKRLPVPS
jgi:hypothetical protein